MLLMLDEIQPAFGAGGVLQPSRNIIQANADGQRKSGRSRCVLHIVPAGKGQIDLARAGRSMQRKDCRLRLQLNIRGVHIAAGAKAQQLLCLRRAADRIGKVIRSRHNGHAGFGDIPLNF